jgi:[ribosomal protein S5]-alanine N-acetyltransferase
MLDVSAAFAAFPVLETERLLLRAMIDDDAAATMRPMAEPTAALGRIERIHAAFAEQRGVRWAIAPRQGGELIGSCGFWRIDTSHFRAEIGYELDPEHWGQGLMPEALRAMLDFGFTNMGLHSVEANIDPDNHGSRRVLEKLGFVQEGYFRENYWLAAEERFSDSAILSLLVSDWTRSPRG